MLLPHTAEYAVRAAATLAMLPKGVNASATEIAKKSRIPQSYLSKILRRLVKAKILKAKKGPGGGFVFTRPIGKISLLTILEAVDFDFDENHCFFGWDRCNNKKPCPLHGAYSDLKNSYYTWAKETTLASISKPPED